MAVLRSLYRSSSYFRSSHYSIFNGNILNALLPKHQQPSRSFFALPHSSSSSTTKTLFNRDCRAPFGLVIGSFRAFSQDVAPLPDIKDSKLKAVFKDFMAADWGELPNSLIHDAVKVLSKNSDDKSGKEALKNAFHAAQAAEKMDVPDSLIDNALEGLSKECVDRSGKEALENVFRAAEAAEEFIGILDTFKMAIDDLVGLSGENVKPLPEHYSQALETAYDRYSKYLDSFGPNEYYLKKKIETELGRRMIHLKMRCGGLDSAWGKVTVLGTSGISGSYVEQRGP